MAGNPECNKDGHEMHMCSIKAEEIEKWNLRSTGN